MPISVMKNNLYAMVMPLTKKIENNIECFDIVKGGTTTKLNLFRYYNSGVQYFCNFLFVDMAKLLLPVIKLWELHSNQKPKSVICQ